MVPHPKPPPPLEATNGTLQSPETAVRNRGRYKQFLVDWEGYGPEEREWVPQRNIDNPSLIQDFYAEHQVPS